MWEYVIVVFPRVRDVFIDGHRVGQTNQLLHVSRGQHLFHLGAPVTYRPPTQSVNVVNTTWLRPALVRFEPTSFT